MPVDSVEVTDKQSFFYLYPAALLILLVVEVVALTVRFDTGKLSERRDWLLGLIAYSPPLISLGISIATVGGLVLFGLVHRDQDLHSYAGPVWQSRRVWLWFPGHLAAYAGLAWLTHLIFERSTLSSNLAAWDAIWISTGLAVLVLWMLALLPLKLWCLLVRKAGRRWCSESL